MTSAYIKGLRAEVAVVAAEAQAQRADHERAAAQAVRDRLVPLEQRLARLLKNIPDEIQQQGVSLSTLQRSLRGRWRGCAHSGEIGLALRRLGHRRERRWQGEASAFRALWYPPG